jgi:hypothetical protein
VHQGDCKSILQAQEEEREVSRRARESSLKDIEERGTLKVFKPSKVTEESAQELCKECRRSSRIA